VNASLTHSVLCECFINTQCSTMTYCVQRFSESLDRLTPVRPLPESKFSGNSCGTITHLFLLFPIPYHVQWHLSSGTLHLFMLLIYLCLDTGCLCWCPINNVHKMDACVCVIMNIWQRTRAYLRKWWRESICPILRWNLLQTKQCPPL